MKIVKALLAVVGLIGLVAAGMFVFLNWVDAGRLLAAANSNKSGNLFPDLMPRVYLSAGLAAAGGLLVGLGIGLPVRTAGQVRRLALEEAVAQKAVEAGPAAGSGPAADGASSPA